MKAYPEFTDRQKRIQRNHLLAILKILDVSQTGLSELLGVSRGLVSRWLTGSCRISPASAIKLSKLVPDITIKQLCPLAYEGM